MYYGMLKESIKDNYRLKEEIDIFRYKIKI